MVLIDTHRPATLGVRAALAPRGLRIPVVAGIGQGQTLLSAFDNALFRAGVFNFNLLYLSSVIPPGSYLEDVERFTAPVDEFGHRLYVVKAEARSATPGAAIAAGIGWYQWGDDRGCLVEHEVELVGSSRDEAEAAVAALIGTSLRDLTAVRGIAFAEEGVGSRIVSTRVEHLPACALVLAVFESEGWR